MARIYHPVLDRTVDVPDRTVRIWERSGWTTAKRRTRTRSTSPVLDETTPAEGDPQPLNKED